MILASKLFVPFVWSGRFWRAAPIKLGKKFLRWMKDFKNSLHEAAIKSTSSYYDNHNKHFQFLSYLHNPLRGVNCAFNAPDNMSKRNNKATSGQLAGAEAIKDFPNFDENALNALTERIEKGLDKTQSKSSKDKDKSSSGKSPQTHKEDKSGKVADKKEGNNSHGKKRDARGNVKDEKKGSKKSKDAALSDDRAQLLEEILALGGTEDDLDLVADAFSDEEEEPEKGTTKASDKTFMKDLAQFAAGLGIESQVVDESSDEADDEDVEEQEDQYWEDGSNTDALDEEVQALPTPVVAQKATLSKVPELTKPKDVSRLVSGA